MFSTVIAALGGIVILVALFGFVRGLWRKPGKFANAENSGLAQGGGNGGGHGH